MKYKYAVLFFALMFFVACSENLQEQNQIRVSRKSDYVREKFDPSRNPFLDLQKAIEIATKENKRIILDIGGEWCIWCHRIDKFLHSDSEIEELLKKHYIMLKINFSKENKNEKFLSRFPEIGGYPHFFVLDSDGTFLHSQDTGLLEEGKTYSKNKIMNFLKKWAK